MLAEMNICSFSVNVHEKVRACPELRSFSIGIHPLAGFKYVVCRGRRTSSERSINQFDTALESSRIRRVRRALHEVDLFDSPGQSIHGESRNLSKD
jgi:hypothetical protein